MWRTVLYNDDKTPHLVVNEEGEIFNYNRNKFVTPKKGGYKNLYDYVRVGRKVCRVHTIVAKAFPEICGKWFEGCEIHHIDGNPSNNTADNLIVLTIQQHKQIHKLNKLFNPNKLNYE